MIHEKTMFVFIQCTHPRKYLYNILNIYKMFILNILDIDIYLKKSLYNQISL